MTFGSVVEKISLLLLAILSGSDCYETYQFSASHTSYNGHGHRLSDATTVVVPGVHLWSQCIEACLDEANCVSFNFNDQEKICEINHMTQADQPLLPAPGYSYMTLDDVAIPKVNNH